MINFAVINLKNLIINLIKIIILISLVFGIMNIGDLIVKNTKKINYVDIIKDNISFTLENTDSNNILTKIIASEMPILSSNTQINSLALNEVSTEEDFEEELVPNTDSSEPTTETQDFSVPENLTTSVVSQNNLAENYNLILNNVKIKNETSFNLGELINSSIEYTNKNDIVIFHTHTCESYTQTVQNQYIASGNFRTTDTSHSVVQVGSLLSDALTSKGFNVIHSKAYHDYPAYNGSYSRSYDTVEEILKNNPNVQTVIDLHRDAIGSMSSYAPCVQIGDEKVAQLMFVIGTNGGGLSHANWQSNFNFALKIQEKANEMYPGLFRPMIVRNSRYNQNLADSAFIIEVGATGNTLEEATASMKYLANVFEEVMK